METKSTTYGFGASLAHNILICKAPEKRSENGSQRQETKLGFPSLLNIHAAVAAIKKPGEMSEAAERDIRRRWDRLPLNQPTHEGAAFHTTDKMQRPIVLVTRIRMHPVHPEFRSWVRGRVGIPKFVSHEGLVAICRGAAKEISVGGAHIAFLAMCAMNLPSISAHMQRTHVCGTQRNREANFGFQVYGRTRGGAASLVDQRAYPLGK
jgi:hypothetical protein